MINLDIIEASHRRGKKYVILSLNIHTNERTQCKSQSSDLFHLYSKKQLRLSFWTKDQASAETGYGGLPATQKRNVSNVFLITCIHPWHKPIVLVLSLTFHSQQRYFLSHPNLVSFLVSSPLPPPLLQRSYFMRGKRKTTQEANAAGIGNSFDRPQPLIYLPLVLSWERESRWRERIKVSICQGSKLLSSLKNWISLNNWLHTIIPLTSEWPTHTHTHHFFFWQPLNVIITFSILDCFQEKIWPYMEDYFWSLC